MNVFKGNRPDITPAQLMSVIPVVCGLLAAFGIWTPTDDQSDALNAAMAWAAALVLGDAGLRVGRGFAAAKKDVAAIETPGVETPAPYHSGTTYSSPASRLDPLSAHDDPPLP